jgi:hypothetical protein
MNRDVARSIVIRNINNVTSCNTSNKYSDYCFLKVTKEYYIWGIAWVRHFGDQSTGPKPLRLDEPGRCQEHRHQEHQQHHQLQYIE